MAELNDLIAKSEEIGFIKGMNNAKNICEKELERIKKVQKEEQQFTQEEFLIYKECLEDTIIEILKETIK